MTKNQYSAISIFQSFSSETKEKICCSVQPIWRVLRHMRASNKNDAVNHYRRRRRCLSTLEILLFVMSLPP